MVRVFDVWSLGVKQQNIVSDFLGSANSTSAIVLSI